MKKSSLIMTCVFFITILVVCLSGCSDGEYDESATISEATTAICAILDEHQVDYASVIAEKKEDETKDYSLYSIVVLFDSKYDKDYKTMYEALKYIEKTKYTSNRFDEKVSFTRAYVRCNEYQYELCSDSTDYRLYSTPRAIPYGKSEIFNDVYNSIAEKRGVDLSISEKAVIYAILDSWLTHQGSDGQYSFPESYCYNHVAEKYNVTESYLRSSIYIYSVFQEYSKGGSY